MSKTPKGRALGNALRRAREDRGLTVRQFAARLSRDAGIVSRWETGTRTPKPEHVAQLLTALGINGDRYEEIVALAYAPEESNWVATTLPAQRQQLAALLDFEQRAEKITEVSPLLVPGLLQTADYFRAMMTTAGIPVDELADRLAERMGRQEVLRRVGAVHLIALVGQAALHQLIGNVSVMVGQLCYLHEMARHPNVEIRVVPYNAGWHPGLEGSFEFIEPYGERPVVAVENRRSGLFLHEDSDVRAYRRAADNVLQAAMNAEDSIRLVRSLAGRMEKTR